MRILVVEDQPEMAAVMAALLGQMGHEIVLATTGEDALLACHSTDPDFIFMDIELPGMDGYEATRRLKRQCALRDVPVWAITTLPDDASKRKEGGMVGYLSKPISLERLQSAIEGHIAKQRMRPPQMVGGNRPQFERPIA
jgi:CheY-like chemotaxis protein